MAKDFTESGNSLIVTDTVSGEIVFEAPKKDVFFSNDDLNNSIIRVYDISGLTVNEGRQIKVDFADALIEGVAADATNTRNFQRTHLGVIPATPASVQQVADDLDAHENDTNNPHDVMASQIYDFDDEVGSHPDVAANTARRLTADEYANVMIENVILEDDFESANPLTLVNGSETNKWEYGTATAQSGTKSLYISNDAGVTNNYDNTTSSIVHAYVDVTFNARSKDNYIEFMFKCDGEVAFDYMQVNVSETSFTPTAGSSVGANGVLQSTSEFSSGQFDNQLTWKEIKIDVDETITSGTKRIIFSWINDGSFGTNPGAAIDNLRISQQIPRQYQ